MDRLTIGIDQMDAAAPPEESLAWMMRDLYDQGLLVVQASACHRLWYQVCSRAPVPSRLERVDGSWALFMPWEHGVIEVVADNRIPDGKFVLGVVARTQTLTEERL